MSLIDEKARVRLNKVLSAPDGRIDRLVEIAGLDPTRDLRYADLREVDFRDSVLIGWDFTGADLRAASFRGAKLSKCIFTDAVGVNLAGSVESTPATVSRGASRAPVSPAWDDVRAFLEVARRGSFRSASDFMGVAANQLRSRVTRLEAQLGTMLLTRHVDGVRLTAEGRTILDAASRMEAASSALSLARDRAPLSPTGEVRIAMTEAIGGFWLVPELTRRKQDFPELLFDFRCAPRSADVLRLEADVSIQMTKPTSPDLKLVKLGRLHSLLFGSPAYLQRAGMPTTLEEIRQQHRLVLEVGGEGVWEGFYERLFPATAHIGFVALRNNTLANHYFSIISGAGLGWLPNYSGVLASPSGALVPIDVPQTVFSFDIWLTYHPDASRIPRVRRTIDWILDAFDPKRFRWFGDEFIHPNEISKELQAVRDVWSDTAPVTPKVTATPRQQTLEQPVPESVYEEISRTVEAIKDRSGPLRDS